MHNHFARARDAYPPPHQKSGTPSPRCPPPDGWPVPPGLELPVSSSRSRAPGPGLELPAPASSSPPRRRRSPQAPASSPGARELPPPGAGWLAWPPRPEPPWPPRPEPPQAPASSPGRQYGPPGPAPPDRGRTCFGKNVQSQNPRYVSRTVLSHPSTFPEFHVTVA